MQAIARYANESSFIYDDREPQPRGIGVKVFDVEGERLPNYSGTTQDRMCALLESSDRMA